MLWTDDKNGLQLSYLKSADRDSANALRRELREWCRRGVAAPKAFDVFAGRHGDPGKVEVGELSHVATIADM
ncbi:hypothetical protein CH282_15260 [Rhodococcus sp. 06-418-1B]|nr:hypothetical protein [Rhodococcus sp. 06-418-1B]OZC84493.1 hypothetical protein CH282_15260 [Rhodococcus sp. 06-418-1B]